MKMQIAFRGTDQTRKGYGVAIAAGVIETHPLDRLAYNETMLAFKLSFTDEGRLLLARSSREPAAITDGYGYSTPKLVDLSSLDDLLTSNLLRIDPSGFLNAEFALRETAVEPSEEGATVYAFMGLAHIDRHEKIDFGKLYQLESRDGFGDAPMFLTGILGDDIRPEFGQLDMVEDFRGKTMEQVMQEPLWGFGEEAVALPGTRRIENYRQQQRFLELHFGGVREGKEYDYLVNRMDHIGMGRVLTDPVFERYVAARLSDPHMPKPYLPTPRSRTFTRTQALETLVGELISENPAMGRHRR